MARQRKIGTTPLRPLRASEPTTDIQTWLDEQPQLDTLRFMTCGSMGDGKSTLIGRLLWDAQQLFDDQLASLETESAMRASPSDAIDFTLLVDGLSAEREQGMTIDVAYRFFATRHRRFIVADTPGHEKYTRNMATAASTADVAIVLVDARHGVQTQTRRHVLLASLLGVRRMVLAVNKMDLVGFERSRFEAVEQDFRQIAQSLRIEEVACIPLAALHGDNVATRSTRMRWYSGPTLLGCLETLDTAPPCEAAFAFPVQWINRATADARGMAGTVASGVVRRGDEVRIAASGQCAKVAAIVTFNGDAQEARTGDAITLVLDRATDVSRGDVLSLASEPVELGDHFKATIIWMHEEPGLTGRNYEMKLASQWQSASITTIKHRINVDTQAAESAREIALNEVAVVNIATGKPVAFAPYGSSRTLGSFLLVDSFTKNTVAVGMIQFSLRRSQNVHRQPLSITREDRERMNGYAGKVIWFTGLSGSGKSTIANAVEQELFAAGRRTYILDGDNIRQGLNKNLGFDDADRVENIRRIAEVAKLMLDAGLTVLTAFISPFRRERAMARELIGADRFVEVHVSTPLDVCEQRDPKGLYKKSRSGQLPNLTGIGSAYEAPEQADLVLNADGISVDECVERVLRALER
ncbi:adenylyl-sulfate kinase [Paraburkholderia bannensis]|uniref:adenylyl-sulfate kinase n=1 Tax=Paraburkholderia bannensis TaxID=765414 RepID=UPI000A0380DA